VNLAITDDFNSCKNNYYYALTSESVPTPPPNILPSHTGIADSGATDFYFAPDAPVINYNFQPPTVGVRVANGRPERSVASATLASVPSLPQAAKSGHVMPPFPHTLIGLGPFADLGCNIVFTKTTAEAAQVALDEASPQPTIPSPPQRAPPSDVVSTPRTQKRVSVSPRTQKRVSVSTRTQKNVSVSTRKLKRSCHTAVK